MLKKKYSKNTLPNGGLGKIPPSAIDSEGRVLSACLNGFYSNISTIIKDSEDFYIEKNQILFEAIKETSNKGKEITKLQLARSLGSENLERIGGAYYLTEISDVPYSEKDVINDAMYVLEKSIARRAISKCSDIISKLFSDDDVFNTIDEISTFQNEVNNKLSSLSVFSFKEEMEFVIKDVELRHNGESQTDIFTGITKIDNVLGGFQKKTLNILGARPGGGKTAMSIQFMNNFSFKQQNKSLFFSLEMSTSQILERLTANYCSEFVEVVSNFEIKKGFIGNDKKYEKFIESAKNYDTKNIFIYDNIYSIQEIRNKSIQMVKNHGIDVIFIDHFHIIQSTTQNGNDLSKYTEISGLLKMLAKDCNVPVICLAQLSRGTESRDNKMPILSDLRGSGSIEQDADTVSFFFRPNYYESTADPNDLQMSVAKNRNGGCENFSLWVDIKNSTFLDDIRPYGHNPLPIPTSHNQFFQSLELDIPF